LGSLLFIPYVFYSLNTKDYVYKESKIKNESFPIIRQKLEKEIKIQDKETDK